MEIVLHSGYVAVTSLQKKRAARVIEVSMRQHDASQLARGLASGAESLLHRCPVEPGIDQDRSGAVANEHGVAMAAGAEWLEQETHVGELSPKGVSVSTTWGSRLVW